MYFCVVLCMFVLFYVLIVVLCIFCVVLCTFVLFYVFLCRSMYFRYELFVLCRSLYCLCVYVYCTTATGWLPNCS